MSLEELKSKALFQNTIDVWIMLCKEKNKEWYDIDAYIKFIKYLKDNNVKINAFPLCVKESTNIERGKDKSRFLDELSRIGTSMIYTIKLDSKNLSIIRTFER
jgi:hypothetical protein